jgi:hypothetical protein
MTKVPVLVLYIPTKGTKKVARTAQNIDYIVETETELVLIAKI